MFAEVLGLCAALGMGKLGMVALDGMKIAAAASKSANRTEETLRKMAAETVAAHAAADAAEDDLFGEGRRGDEVPPEAADPRTRSQKIGAALRARRVGAALAGLEAGRSGSALISSVAPGCPFGRPDLLRSDLGAGFPSPSADGGPGGDPP